MTIQVQELIDKIKSEGIQEAEQKAKAIENEARNQAERIIHEAREDATKIVNDAEQQSQKINISTHMALQQAARDMTLTLRKEIQALLKSIVTQDVDKALSSDQLAQLINEIIKAYGQQNQDVSDITVTLSPRDLKKLKDGFLAKLKDKMKRPVTFRSADDIHAGFSVSFDGGKSCFDFTDESLVEFLSGYLNAEVSSLLNKAIHQNS